MNFSIKEVKWEECEKICKDICANNPLLTPYQSYDFLSIVKLGRKETNPLYGIGFKEKNFVMFRERNPIAVIPIYVNRSKKIIFLRGEVSIIAHLDFIYDKTISVDEYKYIFTFLGKCFKGYILKFNRLSEKSKTYKAIKKLRLECSQEELICVTIPFFEGYDEWFKGLKKSFKQDVRSGANRLKSDNREYEFRFDLFEQIDNKAKNEILKLYSKRACEHSGIKHGIYFYLVQSFLIITKKKNPFNIALESSNDYIGGRIYIDGIIVAYCQGLLSKDGRVIVPKLSIDLNYKRYNLGALLINEMINHITTELGLDKANQLDLSRGNERYKYDYGGIEHYNYDMKIIL